MEEYLAGSVPELSPGQKLIILSDHGEFTLFYGADGLSHPGLVMLKKDRQGVLAVDGRGHQVAVIQDARILVGKTLEVLVNFPANKGNIG